MRFRFVVAVDVPDDVYSAERLQLSLRGVVFNWGVGLTAGSELTVDLVNEEGVQATAPGLAPGGPICNLGFDHRAIFPPPCPPCISDPPVPVDSPSRPREDSPAGYAHCAACGLPVVWKFSGCMGQLLCPKCAGGPLHSGVSQRFKSAFPWLKRFWEKWLDGPLQVVVYVWALVAAVETIWKWFKL